MTTQASIKDLFSCGQWSSPDIDVMIFPYSDRHFEVQSDRKMKSPDVRRLKKPTSPSPLLRERQLSSLDPKVTFFASTMRFFRHLLVHISGIDILLSCRLPWFLEHSYLNTAAYDPNEILLAEAETAVLFPKLLKETIQFDVCFLENEFFMSPSVS